MTLKQALGKMKWKNFFFLTVAGMVNAFGVTMFIAPVDLYDSGISGTSILLSQLTQKIMHLCKKSCKKLSPEQAGSSVEIQKILHR